jgi:ribonuclease R
MENQIISLLKQREQSALTLESISKKLNIKDKKSLIDVLSKMVKDGTLFYSEKKKKYLLFENSNLYKGSLSSNKNNNYYLITEDKKINIPKEYLNNASPNDTVVVYYDEALDYGKVLNVISKYKSNYVGEVIDKHNNLYIYEKSLGKLEIEPTNYILVDGHKIIFTINNGKAQVQKVLGHKDDPGIDIASVIVDHGFSLEFSKEALEELQRISKELTEEEIDKYIREGRIDYRDKIIFTIDGKDTKDIDDAISIEIKDNDDIELGVYIADVSEYIKENTYLDEEAREKTTSVYTANSVNPMFPHEISNGICSLNPNANRLALCFITTFDKFGKVKDFNITEGVIRSRMKMNYDDVNKILEDDDIIEDYMPYLKSLYQMQKLSLLLSKDFCNKGMLNFSTCEAKVILDDEYIPIGITKRSQKTAEKIIENFMIITNINAMEYLDYLGLPGLHRVHDEPASEKLELAINIINKKYRITDNLKKNLTKKDLQKIIKCISNIEESEVLNRLLITSLAKAKYTEDNIGHYAISTDNYGHFTSPIRRYPDLENHRIIKSYLHKGYEETIEKYNDLYELAGHCSKKERDADSCEREVTKMKMAEYLQDKIGTVYRGTISNVCKYGYWVLLDNLIEGFVRIDSLPPDNYKYNEYLRSLVGRHNEFSIGDRVDIVVKGANKETSSIDFDLISKELEKDEEKENSKKKIRKIN